jgi:hypothetical protein
VIFDLGDPRLAFCIMPRTKVPAWMLWTGCASCDDGERKT